MNPQDHFKMAKTKLNAWRNSSFSLQPKEKRLVIVLIGLVCGLTCMLYFLHQTQQKHQTKPDLVAIPWQHLDVPQHASLMTPKPFEKQPEILANINDDAFLETAEFDYLIHQALAMQPSSSSATCLVWKDFSSSQKRKQMRGEKIRIQGFIKDLRKKELTGQSAEARGIAGRIYWQAAFLDIENHLHFIAFTQFPKKIGPNDLVEVDAYFFKLWEYQSQTERKTQALVFIGQKLQKAHLPTFKATGIYDMALFTGCLLILIGFVVFFAYRLDQRFLSYLKKKS